MPTTISGSSGINTANVTATDTVTSVDVTTSGTVNSANVTASDTITDSQGNVRALEVFAVGSTSYTIPSGSSGKLFEITSGCTSVNINAANFAVGDIITIFNRFGNAGGDLNIVFDNNFSQEAVNAADGTNFSNSTRTLTHSGLLTITCSRSNGIVVAGNIS